MARSTEEKIDAWTAANPSGVTRKEKLLGKFKTAARLAGDVSRAAKVLNGRAMRVQLLFESTERPCSIDPTVTRYESLHATVARLLGLTPVGIATGGPAGNGAENDAGGGHGTGVHGSDPRSAAYAVYYENATTGEVVEIDTGRRWADAVMHARELGPTRRLVLHVRERPREEPVLTRKMGIGRVSRKWERTGREYVRYHTRLFLAQGEPVAVEPEAHLERDLFTAEEEDETFARVCLRGIVSSLAVTRVPINLIVLVDTSASMQGAKITAAKAAARSGADTLQSGDQLTVIAFDTDPHTVVPTSVKGSAGEKEWAAGLASIGKLEAGGTTNMQAALAEAAALAELAFSASKTNRVLLITDGKPNKAEGLLESVSGLSKKGISTTTLGIGDDFNEELLSQLAERGLGSCYYVRHGDQMIEVMKQEIANLSLIVGRQCRLTLKPAKDVSINEVYGFPSGLAQTGETVVEIGDVVSNESRDVLVRISFPPMEKGNHKLLEFQVSYLDTATNQRSTSSVLKATFTQNEAELSASAPVGLVVERVAKAHTARAMRIAMEKLSNDDMAGALDVLNCQAAEVLLAAKKATGEGPRQRLGKLSEELGFHGKLAARRGKGIDGNALRKELAVRAHQLNTK